MAQAGLLDLLNMVTGNTPENRRNQFVDNELPDIANRLYKSTTAEEIAANATALIGAAQKAGYGPKNVELLLDRLVQPARANLGGGELQKIGERFKSREGFVDDRTAQFNVMPEGAGTEESPQYQGLAGMMPAQKQTFPGKKFDQGDALDIASVGSRYGMKTPEGLASLLTAPSGVEENMGQAAAANALAAERRADEQRKISQNRTLENLSDEAEASTGLSPRDVGVGSGGSGLAGLYTNARNIEAQRPVRESTVALNKTRGVTEGARQGELGTRSQANVALAERRRRENEGAGDTETTTETERMVDPLKQLDAQDAIAEAAEARGASTPQEIAAIADDMGYEIEGTPELATAGGFLGMGGKPTLKGNFRLRPKAQKKTTTKAKGAPGSRAAPAATKAARLKFDAQGNLVK